MKCRDVKRWLDAENGGGSWERIDPAVRRHIQECSRCRFHYETLLLVERGLKEISAEAPPADLLDDFLAGVYQKLEEQEQISSTEVSGARVFSFARRFRSVLAAAAALLIAFGTWWLVDRQISRHRTPTFMADDVEYYLQQFDEAAASNPVAVVKGIEYEWAFYENGGSH